MTEMEKWNNDVERMRKFIELNAPKVVKASLIVRLVVVRLAKICNCVPEVAADISRLITEKMLEHTGKCVGCKYADAVSGEGLCPKCSSELDQAIASYEEPLE